MAMGTIFEITGIAHQPKNRIEEYVLLLAASTIPFMIYARMYGGMLVTISFYLVITCKLLTTRFKLTTKQLVAYCQANHRDIPLTQIMERFDDDCVKLSMCNFFWKRLLFIHVAGHTILIGTLSYMVIKAPLPPVVKIGGSLITMVVAAMTTMMILAPAVVNASARRIHNRLCSLALNSNLIHHERQTLANAMKRFLSAASAAVR